MKNDLIALPPIREPWRDAGGLLWTRVESSHMDPAYRPGDLVRLEPCADAQAEHDYILETGAGGDRWRALVRIADVTPTAWRCWTYTPARVLELPRAIWRPVFWIGWVSFASPRAPTKWDGRMPEGAS